MDHKPVTGIELSYVILSKIKTKKKKKQNKIKTKVTKKSEKLKL